MKLWQRSSRPALRLLFLWVALPLAPASVLTAQEKLDNAAVVQMVKERLGTDIIVEQIRINPGSYALTTASLIRLHQLGVPEKVIAAMQAKMSGSAADPAANPVSTAKSVAASVYDQGRYPAQGSMETWESGTWKAYMTEEEHPELRARVSGTNGSRFRVEALCKNETGIWLTIENETPGKLLKSTEMARHMSSNTTEGWFGGSLNTSSSIGPARSCVVAKVAEGTGEVKDMTSTDCDKRNAAELWFQGKISKQRYEQVMKDHPDPSGKIFNSLMGLFSSLTGTESVSDSENIVVSTINMDNGEPLMGWLQTANVVRLGLSFQDESFSTFEIHPQQPAFKEYVAKCLAMALPEPLVAAERPAVPSSPPAKAVLPRTIQPADALFMGTNQLKIKDTFRGSVDGFAGALPAYLERANESIGAPIRSYDKEIAYIADAVRRCAGITAQQAASVTVHGFAGDFVNIAKLGHPYQVCSTPVAEAVPNGVDPSKPAVLMLSIRPRGVWGDGTGETVGVSFTEVGWLGTAPAAQAGTRGGIIFAVIDGSSPAGAKSPITVERNGAQATPTSKKPNEPAGGMDVNQILSEAESIASAQQKSVMVLYGASWCPGCTEFQRFTSSSILKPILDKYFVIVEIKINEELQGKGYLNTPNGYRSFASYSGSGNTIPYTVIVDGTGKRIADSIKPLPGNPKGENIGYPGHESQVEWFMQMLKAGAPLEQYQGSYTQLVSLA